MPAELEDAVGALLLEALVTHRQCLIDQQDIEVESGGDGKAQADVHA